MPTFVLTYRNPRDHARTPDTTATWYAWFDSMRDQLVDFGKPVISRTSIGNVSADSTELAGYSLISAEDIDAAVAVAKGCPSLDHSGGVEIGELGEVPPRA